MLVDVLDIQVIPALRNIMLDYHTQHSRVPKRIITGGNQVIPGSDTGTLYGNITIEDGSKHRVGLPTLVVLRLRHPIFCSNGAANGEIATIIERSTLASKRGASQCPSSSWQKT